MILPGLKEINTDVELLTPQSHENVAIIPIKTPVNYNIDLLTLKKGFELGLVEVKECEKSTVNTLIVKNNSITPLILIDGEEVIGGDQNRIVNSTTIIAPQSSMPISVSCTERGRWAYKNEFKNSENIADYNTRRVKAYASRSKMNVQSKVWNSIDDLESELHCASPTSAMSESYENQRTNLNKILESFEVVDGQTGVLVIINGEIKGFEIMLNSEIYRDFHEKILKSYLIGSKVKTTTFTINVDEARLVIDNAMDSTFEIKQTKGMENSFEFENPDGLGEIHIFENELIHWSYFTKDESEKGDVEIADIDHEDVNIILD